MGRWWGGGGGKIVDGGGIRVGVGICNVCVSYI